MQVKTDRFNALENQVTEFRAKLKAIREEQRTALAALSIGVALQTRTNRGKEAHPPGGHTTIYVQALTGKVDKRYKRWDCRDD